MKFGKTSASAGAFMIAAIIVVMSVGVGPASSASLAHKLDRQISDDYKQSSLTRFANKVKFIKTAGAKNDIKPQNSKVGTGALNFIDSMANRGIAFLSDNNLGDQEKKTEFKKLLNQSFDLKTMGRFSLGRYWRTSTPQQRDKYLTLFQKVVLEVYAQRFSDYQGQKFETRKYRLDGKRDVIVSTAIVSSTGPEIQVDWRVRYKDGRYKIVDVIVEGVSMSLTQRSDFASVIQRGGGNVQTLITHLESKIL